MCVCVCVVWHECWHKPKLYFVVAAMIGLNRVSMQTVINVLVEFKESRRKKQSAFSIGDGILIISSHPSWYCESARGRVPSCISRLAPKGLPRTDLPGNGFWPGSGWVCQLMVKQLPVYTSREV